MRRRCSRRSGRCASVALGHPVGAGDGLEQAMLLQRLVEVHHRFDGRVEAGQQLVADDQEARALAPSFERLLAAVSAFRVEIVGSSGPRGSPRRAHPRSASRPPGWRVDAGRHGSCLCPGRLLRDALRDQVVGDHPVERPLVENDRLTVDGDDLGLEPVRPGIRLEVGPDVIGDQLDALRDA